MVTGQELGVSKQERGELGLWQRRYWEHQIRDERDLERHVDYIHWNPVKHGYVRQVKEWPYSSFHRFVERGLYPPDWTSDLAGCKPPQDNEFGEVD